MKKWNDRLPRVTKLEKQEMKLISGGSRVASGNCCAYNNDWRESGFTCLNYGGSPGGAAFMAGEEGWWGCNSAEIIEACGDVC